MLSLLNPLGLGLGLGHGGGTDSGRARDSLHNHRLPGARAAHWSGTDKASRHERALGQRSSLCGALNTTIVREAQKVRQQGAACRMSAIIRAEDR